MNALVRPTKPVYVAHLIHRVLASGLIKREMATDFTSAGTTPTRPFLVMSYHPDNGRPNKPKLEDLIDQLARRTVLLRRSEI